MQGIKGAQPGNAVSVNLRNQKEQREAGYCPNLLSSGSVRREETPLVPPTITTIPATVLAVVAAVVNAILTVITSVVTAILTVVTSVVTAILIVIAAILAIVPTGVVSSTNGELDGHWDVKKDRERGNQEMNSRSYSRRRLRAERPP